MEQWLQLPVDVGTFSPLEVIINISLALILGLVVATVYRRTHKGLSYSQSFTLTIVFVAVIVAIVMMVIGNSLARAFALVGALTIIRFRTVVKDTKDTAFVFAALAVGIAAGTSNYFLAVVGAGFICAIAVVLDWINFGATYKSDFILRFMLAKDQDSEKYLAQFARFANRSKLLHVEVSGDGSQLTMTFDVSLKKGADTGKFAAAIGAIEGVADVALIAAKSEVDY